MILTVESFWGSFILATMDTYQSYVTRSEVKMHLHGLVDFMAVFLFGCQPVRNSTHYRKQHNGDKGLHFGHWSLLPGAISLRPILPGISLHIITSHKVVVVDTQNVSLTVADGMITT